MPPDTLKLLLDMRQAADDISEFAKGKSIKDFLSDKLLRMGVERGFEIIGEALSQLRKIDPSTVEKITDWQDIISFRHVLIHGYGRVNHNKTWDILTTELPLLRRELNALLP